MSDYQKQDRICLVLLLCITLIYSCLSLTPGHRWGDDFAAYLSDGIAIAEGTIEEKISLNAIMHPTHITFEDGEVSELMYVRAIPLLYSVIYRIAGFDVNGNNLIWYKIPNVIFLTAGVCVFYLFLRKREYTPLSAFFLSLLFALHRETLSLLNHCETDVCFCFCSLLSVYLIEEYLREVNGKRKRKLSVCLGFSLWLSLEVRLNGTSLIFLFGYALLNDYFRNGRKKPQLNVFVPFLIPLLGRLILNCFLPEPTSNMNDLNTSELYDVLLNSIYYARLIPCWISELLLFKNLSEPVALVWVGPAVLLYLGSCKSLLDKENVPVIFSLGTLFILLFLPYTQGYRYIINILPYCLLLIAEGWKLIAAKLPRGRIQGNVILCCLSCIILIGSTTYLSECVDKRETYQTDVKNAFNADVLEANAYIRDNLPEDAMISCYKPRLLYLCTHRIGIETVTERYRIYNPADYYLVSPLINKAADSQAEEQPLFQNNTMAIYKRKKQA